MKAATKSRKSPKIPIPISIHAAREGGDSVSPAQMQLINISIHAAREGGDGAFVKIFIGYCISIHAAREGGDKTITLSDYDGSDFNPRRP